MKDFSAFEKQAINNAMNGQWAEAITFNENIIKIDKKNIEAFLRLGFAYLQTNKIKKAKQYYLEALKIQPNNIFVKKNLEKIKILESKKLTYLNAPPVDPLLFVDIPGKTKTVSLVNCGPKNVLAKLAVGQKVFLINKKRRVEIRTENKEYAGCLPDDLSKRLAIFIKNGGIFSVYIKETSLKHTVVLIKEEKKGAKMIKYIAFPSDLSVNLSQMENSSGEENNEEDSEEISLLDLEKLAESLNNEEKDYLPFDHEEKSEESEE
ncbi:MAG: tetratricopeptide repeat protein [Patescibacteria group bacterium]